MLDKIKLLLGIVDDSKDELIQTIIGICKDEAIDFCNLDEYSTKLNSAVIEMVIERYNKIGTEGVYSNTSSGIREEYNSDYSTPIINKLKKNRKVKCV